MKSIMIDTIIAWAQQEVQIRALLLTGSLAGKGPIDDLSDYDIAVFTTDIKKYADDTAWFQAFGTVAVYEPCELQQNNTTYPTRLVIYQDGTQVDFALFDMECLHKLTELDILPVEYNLGYQVLLDKDGITKKLKPATYAYPTTTPPTQEEFEDAIRVFFFEAFKEGKSLVRNDLWHAKIRDWTTKEYLLTMIEWYLFPFFC